jgi:hypothetical protein
MQFSTTAGRFGGCALQFGNEYAFIQYLFRQAQSEIWTGFAFNFYTTNSSAYYLMIFNSPSGIEASITLTQSSGTFQVYRGQLTQTLLGSSSAFNPAINQWNYFETRYLMSSTVGVFEIWVNGTQLLNLTGVNTTQYTSTSFTSITLGTLARDNYESNPMYVCDWYILDTAGTRNNYRLGDSRIYTLLPNSDVGPNNGTPSTGNVHYTMVNENLWSSSNSITINNTQGQEELFGITSLPVIPTVVYGVQITAIAEKTDAGNVLMQTLVVSNSVIGNGANIQVLTSYSHIYDMFETDPNTGNAWTGASINSMYFGVEIAS